MNQIQIKKKEAVTWQGTFRSDADKATIVGEYSDKFQGWQARCPLFGSAHPDLPEAVLVGIKPSKEEGEMIRVKLEYEAHAFSASFPGRGPGFDPVKRYALEPTMERVSILAADRYSSLDDTEREALAQILQGTLRDEDGLEWSTRVTSDDGLEALAKIRGGQDSVYEVGFQWVERSITKTISDFESNAIGKIDTPPGDAPAIAGRNYLRMPGSIQQTADGQAWQMEKRWQMSGRGGWDTDFYSAS